MYPGVAGSEEEKRYARENLEAVNEWLDREGHRTIDPLDIPQIARRSVEPDDLFCGCLV